MLCLLAELSGNLRKGFRRPGRRVSPGHWNCIGCTGPKGASTRRSRQETLCGIKTGNPWHSPRAKRPMENPGARARKATWNQPLRGGLWILGAPTASGTALRPKCFFALVLPGLQPPVWTAMMPTGGRPRVGPNPYFILGQNPPGPQPYLFHCM